MRFRMAFLFLASCSASEGGTGAWSLTVETPRDVDEVVAAVSAMPECGRVLAGGVIHWRAGAFVCSGIQATGCSFPSEDPIRIEVAYRNSAWDSSLPHELCHVCGYTIGSDRGETEAEACAYRAKRARLPVPPAEGGSP
jgi:hypothetical protein